MALYVTLLKALLPLFGLIAIGYGLKRWSVLTHEHVPVLNGLVLKLLLPAAVIVGMLQAPQLSLGLLALPLALFLAELVVSLLVFFLGLRTGMRRDLLGALALTCSFGNTGFVGYPAVQALFPAQFSFGVLVDQFGQAACMYPMAGWLGTRLSPADGGRGRTVSALKRVLFSPPFLALAAGLLLRQIAVPSSISQLAWVQDVSSALMSVLTYLKGAMTPVVLLALGVALKPGEGERGVGTMTTLSIAAKLLVLPAIVCGLCHLFHVGGVEREVTVLQAAMPTGVITTVLSYENRFDARFAVRVVLISTVLSALTAPLMQAMFG